VPCLPSRLGSKRSVLQDAVDTIDGTARKANLTMDVALHSSTVPTTGDSSRLQQAFLNLLTNAVRYTPAGGNVKVSMTVAGESALINIEDTGQGIEPAELPNIFEPFWRGRDSIGDGFGIGLALVRGIVELHDGAIAAFSEGRGMGTRFTVTLPISSI